MKLIDVLTQLTMGELSQISIGGGAAGQIDPSNYAKVVPHINLGLTTLYTRFPLKEGRLMLNLVPGKQTYLVDYRFAQSNLSSQEPVKYIADTISDPYLGDLLKIEEVITDTGWGIVLNDRQDMYSALTPSFNTLRLPSAMLSGNLDIPKALQTSTLELVYRANHYKLGGEDADFDPEDDEVELPEAYLPALLLFVASRAHNPIGMTGEFNAGNNYAAKFEMACKQLEIANPGVDQGSGNYKLEGRGFV